MHGGLMIFGCALIERNFLCEWICRVKRSHVQFKALIYTYDIHFKSFVVFTGDNMCLQDLQAPLDQRWWWWLKVHLSCPSKMLSANESDWSRLSPQLSTDLCVSANSNGTIHFTEHWFMPCSLIPMHPHRKILCIRLMGIYIYIYIYNNQLYIIWLYPPLFSLFFTISHYLSREREF